MGPNPKACKSIKGPSGRSRARAAGPDREARPRGARAGAGGVFQQASGPLRKQMCAADTINISPGPKAGLQIPQPLRAGQAVITGYVKFSL